MEQSLNLKKESNGDIKSINVLFDDQIVGKKSGIIKDESFVVQIHRIKEELKTAKNKTFIRHQFPLWLAWACTAHKVQGLTTSEIVFDLNRVFSPGKQNLKTCFFWKAQFKSTQQKRSKDFSYINFVSSIHRKTQLSNFSGGYLFVSCNNIGRNSKKSI